MSDNDLKAAAERYRRMKTGGRRAFPTDGEEWVRHLKDREILADAYLARDELLRELVTALDAARVELMYLIQQVDARPNGSVDRAYKGCIAALKNAKEHMG